MIGHKQDTDSEDESGDLVGWSTPRVVGSRPRVWLVEGGRGCGFD